MPSKGHVGSKLILISYTVSSFGRLEIHIGTLLERSPLRRMLLSVVERDPLYGGCFLQYDFGTNIFVAYSEIV